MKSPTLLGRGAWLAGMLVLAGASGAAAQVIHPQPPKEYDVSLRFQIRSPLPNWYDRFDEMMAALKSYGFVREAQPAGEPEDPSNDRLDGTIASENARKLLRHYAVQTILLRPRGAKLKAEDRVRVRLELATGLAREQQLKFNRQVMQKLDQLGFREAPGYDHRGFTWIVGTIEVARLNDLLRDLRKLPAGWLAPIEPVSTLQPPLKNRVPIKVIEVLPEPGDVAPAQELAAPPTFPEAEQHLAKIAPELRPLISKEGDESRMLRLELVLDRPPDERDPNWERTVRGTASSVVIEGRVGNIVSVLVRSTQAGELARPPAVIQVRLPRSGEPLKRPAEGPAVNALAESRLDRLHQRGQRGQGIKVVVIDGDFGGYEKFLDKGLPPMTSLVDFTAMRNRSMEPDPMPSTDGAIGPGTLAALAVMQAAPSASLQLVRVDPTAPHQVLLAARLINEPGILPRVLQDRYNEITRDRISIDESRARLIRERRQALDEQVFDEGDPKVPEQRRRYKESQERIQRVEQALKDIGNLEADLQKRTRNFLLRRSELQLLQGARVVVCPLVWNEGYALDGANALSGYFDDKPFVGYPGSPTKSRMASLAVNRGTIWVQAGGDTRGQTWTGLFRDEDGNGAMEFAPLNAPLAQNRWTPELNFLAWQDFAGKSVADLPAKVRLRVTMQWREPHDPALAVAFDDPYLAPIANLGLVVVKQRDPSGKKLSSDDMEIVARTFGTPVRLHARPNAGTYEVATEFDATAGGRFALRVEGRLPTSIRPAGDIAGGFAGLTPELRPRILVEVIDPESRGKGRVVFMDFAGEENWPPADVAKPSDPSRGFGGVGMPADAHNVLTIGAAGADGKSRSYSAVGAGPLREMLVKPNLLGYDALEVGGTRVAGSWVATAFDGGLVACLIGANGPAQVHSLLQILQLPPGTLLRVPEIWWK